MRCAASFYGKSRLWFLPEDIVLKMKNNSLSSNQFITDEATVCMRYESARSRR